jgi:hypothetical protein
VSNLYEYCVNDPVNSKDITGLQSYEDYWYGESDAWEEAFRPAWDEATEFAHNVTTASIEAVLLYGPIVLNIASYVATLSGNPVLGAVFAGASVALTALRGDLTGVGVGLITGSGSYFAKDWRIQLLFILIQLGYDFAPDDLIGSHDTSPAGNPFAVPDNTYVRINRNLLKEYPTISCGQ